MELDHHKENRGIKKGELAVLDLSGASRKALEAVVASPGWLQWVPWQPRHRATINGWVGWKFRTNPALAYIRQAGVGWHLIAESSEGENSEGE